MDRLLGNAAAPIRDAVVDPKAGMMLTRPWLAYFERMPSTLEAIPSRLNAVSLSGQTSSIAATDFANGKLIAGLYRLSYYVRIISAGGGSITVTFRWTDGGVACSYEGITLDLGSATSGTMSESPVVRVDKDMPITYETDWTGGQSYNLDVTLEKVRGL